MIKNIVLGSVGVVISIVAGIGIYFSFVSAG